MRATEGLSCYNLECNPTLEADSRKLTHISREEGFAMRRLRRGTLNKKERREKKILSVELQQLITEQQQKLKSENRPAFAKGLKNDYSKGRQGIFVGNRIF